MPKKPAKKQASRAVSCGPAKAADGGGPATGAKAPAFRLPRDGGGTVELADFAGRKLVLYFYPRADTSGCTQEAIDFSMLKTAFSRAETEILGISADPVAALDRFKAKHKLAVVLASDETHKVLQTYGVWQQKTLYGRKFMGTVRATFLIGPDQRIARVWPKCRWLATPRTYSRQPRRFEPAWMQLINRTVRNPREIAASVSELLTLIK